MAEAEGGRARLIEVRPGPLSWDSRGSAAGTLSGQESAGQVSGTLNLTMGKVNLCVLSKR